MTFEGSNAHLSWAEPRDTGNAPITNYVIEYKAVGDVRWRGANTGKVCAARSFSVEGLSEGTEYEFRVSAENKAGVGPASAASRSAKFGE